MHETKRERYIRILSGLGGAEISAEACKELVELLKEQPERKKGKWEIYIISMLDGEGCKCSECGFEGVPYWNFCPNCGADMEVIR